jgi:hypothetical protein
MQGVTTLQINQYGEYRFSNMNDCEDSTKNCENLFEFEFKFEKPSDTK